MVQFVVLYQFVRLVNVMGTKKLIQYIHRTTLHIKMECQTSEMIQRQQERRADAQPLGQSGRELRAEDSPGQDPRQGRIL